MDTRLLRSFLAVAHAESFTEAAMELGFTQSTVTSHVQKLERQMGGRVLDRLPGGARATDLGARLVPLAEAMLAAEDRVNALPIKGTERPAGTVRVMAPESLCTYRLPSVIGAVRAVEPLIQVWVSPGGVGTSLDAVNRATADIALTLEPQLPPTNLVAERLGAEPLVFLEQPVARIGGATWSDLACRDVLLVEEGCGYSDVIADHLAATGAATGRCSRFGSVEAIKRCVAAGLGWTALPALTTDAELRDGALQAIRGPHLPDCNVYAVTHPRRHLGPAINVVLTEIRKAWNSALPL